MCACCTGRDGGEAAARRHHAELLAAPGWYPAEFSGPCPACDEWIRVGDPIRRVPGPTPAVRIWVGACCGDTP